MDEGKNNKSTNRWVEEEKPKGNVKGNKERNNYRNPLDNFL